MNEPTAQQKYKLTIAKLLAYHDVRDRSDYKDKTIDQIWERVLDERIDDEYLVDAEQILSVAMPLIEKRAREEILIWGDGICDHALNNWDTTEHKAKKYGWLKRRECPKCWQSLRESK